MSHGTADANILHRKSNLEEVSNALPVLPPMLCSVLLSVQLVLVVLMLVLQEFSLYHWPVNSLRRILCCEGKATRFVESLALSLTVTGSNHGKVCLMRIELT